MSLFPLNNLDIAPSFGGLLRAPLPATTFAIDSVSESFLSLCIFSKKFFSTYRSNFVSFLVFAGAAVSFTATISSFETVAKREAILNPVPKQ